jgi:uncharacterized membrane protein
MNAYIVTAHGIAAALCWLVVAVAATVAVFSARIRDTTAERLGLACVAITAFAMAWRVVSHGWVSEGGLSLAGSLAFYVCAVAAKHMRHEPPKLPHDKTRPGALNGHDEPTGHA